MQVEREKADAKKRVELLQLQGENRSAQATPAKAGFGIISVLLVAILAFLLGKRSLVTLHCSALLPVPQCFRMLSGSF